MCVVPVKPASAYSITWVKGHQDLNPCSHPLSCDALNNIAVDHLATRHRTERRLAARQSIPHFPTTRISIQMNGLRLTGQFESMLRYHINGYHLRLYMQERFKWSDSTWRLINHNLFSLHFRSLSPTSQIQHMEFVYDQQALGVRVQQRSPLLVSDAANRCPCCSDACEDQIHFLRCPRNPSHSSALLEFKQSMHSLDLHAIFYLVSSGIQSWFRGSVPSVALWDRRGYPSYMRSDILEALTDQAQIGWFSCLKGFLSAKWTQVATLSMTDGHTFHFDTGTRRLRLVMTSLHALSKALWKGRNDCMHQMSNRETLRLTRVEDLEIQHYYAQPELLAPEDRHYCEQRPLSTLLKSTPANCRRWLRQVKKARYRRHHALRSQSLLPQFFPRIPRQTPSSVPPSSSLSQAASTPTVSISHVPLPPPDPPPCQRSILDFLRRRSI
jgi:hypothetical protein